MRPDSAMTDLPPIDDKRFLRFHKAFRAAVQSRKRSAIVEVLLRAQVPGEQAGRTADKILADPRRYI